MSRFEKFTKITRLYFLYELDVCVDQCNASSLAEAESIFAAKHPINSGPYYIEAR